jgi:hypothetical protein
MDYVKLVEEANKEQELTEIKKRDEYKPSASYKKAMDVDDKAMKLMKKILDEQLPKLEDYVRGAYWRSEDALMDGDPKAIKAAQEAEKNYAKISKLIDSITK